MLEHHRDPEILGSSSLPIAGKLLGYSLSITPPLHSSFPPTAPRIASPSFHLTPLQLPLHLVSITTHTHVYTMATSTPSPHLSLPTFSSKPEEDFGQFLFDFDLACKANDWPDPTQDDDLHSDDLLSNTYADHTKEKQHASY